MEAIMKNYDNMWKAFIRPYRQTYTMNDLGPHQFLIPGFSCKAKRKDFELINKRGLKLQCSFYEIDDQIQSPPIIVYLHCNSGSRLEGLIYMEEVLKRHFSLCVFDCSGSGLSEGQYISLGYYEAEDVECVIKFLKQHYKNVPISLWGRSMGAVTGIIHCAKDPSISCAVYDSPFASLMKLAREIAIDKTGLPKFIVTGALQLIKNTIQTKAKFNISDLDIVKKAEKCTVPALFLSSKKDTFTRHHHSEKLKNAYKGPCKISYFEGEHNESRPDEITKQVLDFVEQHVIEYNRQNKQSKTSTHNIDIPLQQQTQKNINKENQQIHQAKMFNYSFFTQQQQLQQQIKTLNFKDIENQNNKSSNNKNNQTSQINLQTNQQGQSAEDNNQEPYELFQSHRLRNNNYTISGLMVPQDTQNKNYYNQQKQQQPVYQSQNSLPQNENKKNQKNISNIQINQSDATTIASQSNNNTASFINQSQKDYQSPINNKTKVLQKLQSNDNDNKSQQEEKDVYFNQQQIYLLKNANKVNQISYQDININQLKAIQNEQVTRSRANTYDNQISNASNNNNILNNNSQYYQNNQSKNHQLSHNVLDNQNQPLSQLKNNNISDDTQSIQIIDDQVNENIKISTIQNFQHLYQRKNSDNISALNSQGSEIYKNLKSRDQSQFQYKQRCKIETQVDPQFFPEFNKTQIQISQFSNKNQQNMANQHIQQVSPLPKKQQQQQQQQQQNVQNNKEAYLNLPLQMQNGSNSKKKPNEKKQINDVHQQSNQQLDKDMPELLPGGNTPIIEKNKPLFPSSSKFDFKNRKSPNQPPVSQNIRRSESNQFFKPNMSPIINQGKHNLQNSNDQKNQKQLSSNKQKTSHNDQENVQNQYKTIYTKQVSAYNQSTQNFFNSISNSCKSINDKNLSNLVSESHNTLKEAQHLKKSTENLVLKFLNPNVPNTNSNNANNNEKNNHHNNNLYIDYSKSTPKNNNSTTDQQLNINLNKSTNFSNNNKNNGFYLNHNQQQQQDYGINYNQNIQKVKIAVQKIQIHENNSSNNTHFQYFQSQYKQNQKHEALQNDQINISQNQQNMKSRSTTTPIYKPENVTFQNKQQQQQQQQLYDVTLKYQQQYEQNCNIKSNQENLYTFSQNNMKLLNNHSTTNISTQINKHVHQPTSSTNNINNNNINNTNGCFNNHNNMNNLGRRNLSSSINNQNNENNLQFLGIANLQFHTTQINENIYNNLSNNTNDTVANKQLQYNQQEQTAVFKSLKLK